MLSCGIHSALLGAENLDHWVASVLCALFSSPTHFNDWSIDSPAVAARSSLQLREISNVGTLSATVRTSCELLRSWILKWASVYSCSRCAGISSSLVCGDRQSGAGERGKFCPDSTGQLRCRLSQHQVDAGKRRSGENATVISPVPPFALRSCSTRAASPGDTPETDMAGRSIDLLGMTRRRPIATAVIRCAQM